MKKLQELMDMQKEWYDKTFSDGEFKYFKSQPISVALQAQTKELTDSIDAFLDFPNEKTVEITHVELAKTFLKLLNCASHLNVSASSLLLYAQKQHKIDTCSKKKIYGTK